MPEKDTCALKSAVVFLINVSKFADKREGPPMFNRTLA